MPDHTSPLSLQAFQILLSLTEGGDLHGYAIIQDIRDRTAGETNLTASTLYAAIKRMLDAGFLTEVDGATESGGAPRRCYRITRAGLQLARDEAARLQRLVSMARAKRLLPRRT